MPDVNVKMNVDKYVGIPLASYELLSNLPQINGVTVKGEQTGADLGLVDASAELSTAQIKDAAVTAAKIATNAVTADKIINGAVGAAKLADNAVATAKIATGAVITSKVADGAITSDKLGAGAVSSSKIADGAIVKSKLAEEIVTVEHSKDGRWRIAKYSDGRMEIDGTAKNLTCNPMDYAPFGTGIKNYNVGNSNIPSYPVEFTDTPDVVMNIVKTNITLIGNGFTWDAGTKSKPPQMFFSGVASASAVTVDIAIHAVGEWK